MPIEITRLDELLEKFSRARIMVVGDLMLDEYVRGVVDRVSPEAPIPVVNIINGAQRDVRLGGAANVFNNLIALGARDVVLCGVVGDDLDGKFVREYLQNRNLATGGLIIDAGRPTTIKTRIIAHNQQVVRLDREERSPIEDGSRNRLADFIMDKLGSLDAIIFSDYEKGVITPELLEAVLPRAANKGVIVAVDPKFTNFRHFKNVSIVVPNRKEASGFVRYEIISEQDALMAARDILAGLGCANVLIKLGEHGMRLVGADGTDISIRTAAEQVYDVTGAGDTVISTLVLARAAGATWEEAARIANVAAGVVIHYIGTTVITRDLLRRAIAEKKIGLP
ncbi:MAG: D-glycero-beta-D-manno-heptose-7-phosphate kinase [Deltaproteobacteria bacterium]|nr:D-glycero-beta-D-manno-heptose-7-phosphate kinase [Deltaproteobacteria bacterium]